MDDSRTSAGHAHTGPGLLRVAMAALGSAIGAIQLPVLRSAYFFKYPIDRPGGTYAIALTLLSFLGGWLVFQPRSWKQGLTNTGIALLIAGLMALALLVLNPNSVLNNYGMIDL